ncbi:MAG TPA: VOC family protein [bacterium]
MNLGQIHQIAVYARDLDEAIAFYRDKLGARFLNKFDPPGLVFFDFSGVRVLLEKTGPKATLYFWVDDIDAAYAELKSKGIEFLHVPQLIHRDDTGVFGKPGEEEWMAFFSDPSGNVLALATRRASVMG